MLKITVERDAPDATFEIGDLVTLDLAKVGSGPDDCEYVVIVTGGGRKPDLFHGTILFDEGNKSYKVGTHHTDFVKAYFKKFVGKISLESK